MRDVDQRGFDNQPLEWCSAAEATRLLGIKRETLYAYASRGLVRSAPSERGRARRYLRGDLERLRVRHQARSGHGPVAAGALRWGEPVLETRICEITASGPRYAGHDAIALARAGTSFERTAELLWTRALPELEPAWPKVDAGAPRPLLRALVPPGSGVAAAMMAVTASIGLRDGDRFGATRLQDQARGRALIRRLVLAVALTRDARAIDPVLDAPDTATALAHAFGVAPSRTARALIDMALVLSADHELNASSFTARVTASAGADLYACVSAALATHSGSRHGGAVNRVEALAEEIGRPERAAEVVRARLTRGESIDGFGHVLYPLGDPRAVPLLAAATLRAPRNRGVLVLRALCEAMAKRDQLPAVDVAIASAARALGLRRGHAVALFAVGRCAGWIAHALEQRAQGFLVRPRARYVG